MGGPTGSCLAVGFPGQGVDWDAVCSTLRRGADDPIVVALHDTIQVTDWSQVDPADTRLAQPAILAASLLGAPDRRSLDAPIAVGHSFGEITALVWSGAISLADGLFLAAERGRLGALVHQRRPGSMLAVLNSTPSEVEFARRRAIAESGGTVEIAVVNHPRQIVVSGDPHTVDALARQFDDTPARVAHLPIGGPFHTPQMVEAAEEFAAAAASLTIGRPAVPVVFSSGGGQVIDADDAATVPARLGRSLVMPVDWPDAVARARALGAVSGIDAGPGNTLVRLGKKAGMAFRSPPAPSVAVGTA